MGLVQWMSEVGWAEARFWLSFLPLQGYSLSLVTILAPHRSSAVNRVRLRDSWDMHTMRWCSGIFMRVCDSAVQPDFGHGVYKGHSVLARHPANDEIE